MGRHEARLRTWIRSVTAPLSASAALMLVVPAVAATQPQEAVGQDAAFEESVELILHKLRQVGAPTAASACAKKVAACCCTMRYSVVCSRR